MRQVDKAYAERHAGYDQQAEAYLRANAGTFKADGQTFIEFANMGYFNDAAKFADQKGYVLERKALNNQAAGLQSDRSEKIYADTKQTAKEGTIKGIGNWITGNLGTPAPHYVVSGTALSKDKSEAFPYAKAAEKEIGGWTGDKLDRATAVVTLGASSAINIKSAQSISPNNIRFSQNTVSYNKIDRATGNFFTYDDLVSNMKRNGWQGEPIDIVRMPDGKLTSMDNTRISAAREAGISVKANVRNFNDPLPIEMISSRRFGNATTWGEALTNRIKGQKPKGFSTSNPYGTSKNPKITGKQ